MKSTEFIVELYDPQSSYKLKWDNEFGPKEIHAKAYDKQGNYINIDFVPNGKNMVGLEFSRNDSFDITGGGDASRVFGTVIQAINKYLEGYRPKYFVFSAKDSNRYSLYQRLVNRFASSVGYKQFDLNRLKPETREKLSELGTNIILLYDTKQVARQL